MVYELPSEMRTEPNNEREPPKSPSVIIHTVADIMVPPPMEELEEVPPMAPSMHKIPVPELEDVNIKY